MTTAKDEFYRDIIEGLAIYTGSALQRDVLATLSRHDAPDLGAALNKNQIASKMWLADSLLGAIGSDLGDVTILGGWFGVLGAVLLHDPRFTIGKVVSVDIDPRCAAIAESLNATHVRAGRFAATTADMLELDYARAGARSAGRPARRSRHQHELRASGGVRPLVRAHSAGQAPGAPVERLFRVRPARQLRSRSRGVSGTGADARRALCRRAQDAALRPLHADRAKSRAVPNTASTSSHVAAP